MKEEDQFSPPSPADSGTVPEEETGETNESGEPTQTDPPEEQEPPHGEETSLEEEPPKGEEDQPGNGSDLTIWNGEEITDRNGSVSERSAATPKEKGCGALIPQSGAVTVLIIGITVVFRARKKLLQQKRK